MLILKRKDVENLLDLDQLVQSLAPAMADLSAGQVSMPQRMIAFTPEENGLLAAMPVYLPSPVTLSTKLVTVFPQNSARGLPSHQALVLVFDIATGAPLALIDGTYLTAMRTAAGSALATQLLARADASIMAIVGTGVQARAHAQAIPLVRAIKEIRIWGRDKEKARQLAQEITAELQIAAKPVPTFRDAAAGAGIVCATTHAAEPVVAGQWLELGVHVNSVGLNPQGRELDDDTIAKALVIVESREAALTPLPGGANDLTWPIRDGVISEKHIHAEVGELVSGKRQGRTSAEQITLYKSVGVAVQDAVAAQLVLAAAREQGAGIEIEV